MEFPSRVIVLKKQNVVFGTYINPTKKGVEFPGVFKIEQFEVKFPWVLVFDHRISKGVIQFCRISKVESLFSPDFLWSMIIGYIMIVWHMLHGPLTVLHDVLCYYFITIKYVTSYIFIWFYFCLIPFTYSISFILFYCLSAGWTQMIQDDMNSSSGAVGGSYPAFTFVNLRDNPVHTESRKYSSIN